MTLHGQVQTKLWPIKLSFLLSDIADKDGKIKYLEKVIDCVTFALSENVSAKPSKIVSGQEPQKTNELLQGIAQIIEKQIGKIWLTLVLKQYT